MIEGFFDNDEDLSELDSFRAMLQAAVEVGQWAPFDWLLDSPWARCAGCDDLADGLMTAVRRGKGPMRDRILGMRKDWGSYEGVGRILWQAVDAKDEACVKMLVDAGASIDASNTPGGDPASSALGCAVENNDLAMAKFLIALGATARLDCPGEGHLGRAARKGKVEMVKLLLAAGCDPNKANGLDETPIAGVCGMRHHMSDGDRIQVELVEALANAGASLNLVDFMGDAPLHKGCSGRHWAYVEALLAHGAKPWVKTKKGLDVLDMLIEEAKARGVKKIHPVVEKWAERLERGDASEAYCAEASKKLKGMGLVDLGGRIAALGEAIAIKSTLENDGGESVPGRTKTLRV